MWADFDPRALTRAQFATRIASLKWIDWKPIGIVLHNTAAPTLAQWAESGSKHDQRIANLQNFYESKGWHGGPHWFISRDWINEFNSPIRRGTHSPSWNGTHFGIEMVGDYNQEQFDSGDGAKVRDNACYAMAVLCQKFGWDIGLVLKFHKEDPKTTHDCPGKFVVKSDIIARVRGVSLERVPTPHAIGERYVDILATEFGGSDDPQDSAYGGKVDGAQFEVSLPARVNSSQRNVRVFYNGKSRVGRVNDIGPHNRRDAYWNGSGRPLAETQFRDGTVAQNGLVPTQAAGIDLTPAFYDDFGIPGKKGTRSANVDWAFTSIEPEIKSVPAPDIAPPVDEMHDEEPPKPAPAPVPGQLVEPAPAPAPRRMGLFSKITGWISGVGATIGGFLYDYRVALVVVAVLVIVILVVWWMAGAKLKILVNKTLDRAITEA